MISKSCDAAPSGFCAICQYGKLPPFPSTFLLILHVFLLSCSNFQFCILPPPLHFPISIPLMIHNRTREQEGVLSLQWPAAEKESRCHTACQRELSSAWMESSEGPGLRWMIFCGWLILCVGGWYSAVGTQTFRTGGKRTLNIYVVKALAKRQCPRWILRLWFKLCCSWVAEV